MALPGLAGAYPLVLAPLEEISDGPFRCLARRHGADLVFSEFVSAEGLVHGAPRSFAKLRITPGEHPVGIQVFGRRIDSLVAAARLAEQVGPDLIDLNFGCPARKVAGKGGGAALLRTPDLLETLAREVVAAVDLPVTAKVRLGWDQATINVLEVAARLERAGVAAITVHARTRCQRFRGSADWSWIARVKQAVSIPVIGNGDVWEPVDAERMFRETGCDAVMIGRGALGNPWIFARTRAYLRSGICPPGPAYAARVAVILDHLRAAAEVKGEQRAVIEMRKHYRGYLKHLPGAARLRAALMRPESIAAVARTLAAGPVAEEPDDDA